MTRSRLMGLCIVVGFIACGKAPAVCDIEGLQDRAQLCVDRDSLGFSQEFMSGTFIGQAPLNTLTLRNGGLEDLAISGVKLSGDSAFTIKASWAPDVTTGELPAVSVKAKKSVFVEVTFKPTSAKAYTGQFVISSNAQNTPEKSIAITGCGVPSDGGTSPCYCKPAESPCTTTFASQCCSGQCTATADAGFNDAGQPNPGAGVCR